MRASRGSQPAADRRSAASRSNARSTISGIGGKRLRGAVPAPARGARERGDLRVARGRQDGAHALEPFDGAGEPGEPFLVDRLARRARDRDEDIVARAWKVDLGDAWRHLLDLRARE